jgi:hypothetical protein
MVNIFPTRNIGAITLVDMTVRVIPVDVDVDAETWHKKFKSDKKMEENKMIFLKSLKYEKEEVNVKYYIHFYGWDDKFMGMTETKERPPVVFGDIHIIIDKSKPINPDINFYIPAIEIGLKEIASTMEKGGITAIKASYDTDGLRSYLKFCCS